MLHKGFTFVSCLILAIPALLISGCSSESLSDKSVSYVIDLTDPNHKIIKIKATFPADEQNDIQLYMPTWTPGYYVKENYSESVKTLSASSAENTKLPVETVADNQWLIKNVDNAKYVQVSYTLIENGKAVSQNDLNTDYAVINGSSTYISARGTENIPHNVKLVLPSTWKQSASGMITPTENKHTYLAENYQQLIDSPIMAGDLVIKAFDGVNTPHYLVFNKAMINWDVDQAVKDLQTVVNQTRRFWHAKPWHKYVFLVAFRDARGGLEHSFSTLVNVAPQRMQSEKDYHSFMSLVAHEYQHAFNVKRLRPVELGPFDLESPPVVNTLWISEGLTSYYSNLMLRRSGLITEQAYLAGMSAQITRLQKSPGRLKQSIEQSSEEVWNNSLSGVGASDDTVSYYIKGEVAGLLLDAYIRNITQGTKSLDDVMQLAYQQYSGEKGFTQPEFRDVVETITGKDAGDWYQQVIYAPGEVSYQHVLKTFGLNLKQLETEEGPKWQLSLNPHATKAQLIQRKSWLGE